MDPKNHNALSLGREEFDETLAAVEILLDECSDSNELIIEDPHFTQGHSKINLYNHLLRLRDRLRRVNFDLSPNAAQVTIAFN